MLALIAGQGGLPAAILTMVNAPVHVCALEGFAPENIAVDEVFCFEHLAGFLDGLKARGVTQLCMAGAVRRPGIDPARVEPGSAALLERVVGAMAKGDDGTLRALIAIVEEAGIKVVAAHQIVPQLLPERGVLTRVQPGEADRADATRAEQIVAAMGRADVGQACIVAKGQALAIEAAGGTDWMIRSLLCPPERDPALPSGGLLFKAPKPGQDRRADLPVIGPGTVKLAAEARLRGIVIEAGGVMVLQRETVVAMAQAADMFLWVREPGA